MIAEEPVIPSDARRHMVDGTYGGVAKEQVFVIFEPFFSNILRVTRVSGSTWTMAKFTLATTVASASKNVLPGRPLKKLLKKNNLKKILFIVLKYKFN